MNHKQLYLTNALAINSEGETDLNVTEWSNIFSLMEEIPKIVGETMTEKEIFDFILDKNLHLAASIDADGLRDIICEGKADDCLPTTVINIRSDKKIWNVSRGKREKPILEEYLDPEKQQPLQPSHKRLRYVGDFQASDLKNFETAEQYFHISSSEIGRMRIKIKQLREKLNYANRKKQTQIKQPEPQDSSYLVPKALRDLTKRFTDSVKKRPYTPDEKCLALNIQYHSTSAYKTLRNAFQNRMPHPRSVSRWYQNIDGNPGFTVASHQILDKKCTEAMRDQKKILIALTMDEMAVRKHLSYDKINDRFNGTVNFQDKFQAGDNLASKALVFMATAVNDSWKLPVGYFYVNGLVGDTRAKLIVACFEFLQDLDLEIVSLTFDGDPANIKAVEILGGKFSPNDDMQCCFPNPVSQTKSVAIFLDMSHAIKLVRNNIFKCKEFCTGDQNNVRWQHFEDLEQIQSANGFHLGNKIRSKHIQFEANKMKVKLATQLLSESVACSLEYLSTLELPEFEDTSSTIKFCRTFNIVFDIFNSRSLKQQFFKAPLTKRNASNVFAYLDEVSNYILSFKTVDGKRIVDSRWRTGFVGVLMNIQSLKYIFARFVDAETPRLSFLLTYKLSQDHLELFFGVLRRHGGNNDNPTTSQFSASYKRSLLQRDLAPITGNCEAQDSTNNIPAEIPKESVKNLMPVLAHQQEEDFEGDCEMMMLTSDDEELEADLGQIQKNVTTYMSGALIRAIRHKIACELCRSCMIGEAECDVELIRWKDRGGLIYPSPDLQSVCFAAEENFRLFEAKHVLQRDLVKNKLMEATKKNLAPSLLVVDHPDELDTYNHRETLIDAVLNYYFNAKLHFNASLVVENIKKKAALKRNKTRKYLHNLGV